VALTGELATIRHQAALPAGFDTVQAAHSAGLPEESGAASDHHIAAAAREDASRCLALVLSGQGWSSDGMVGDTGIEPVTSSV